MVDRTDDAALALRLFNKGSVRTAFGELSMAENNPYVQSAPLYNLVPANFRTYTSSGGSAGVSSRMYQASTGTTIYGYGAVQSFRSINYKAGQGGLARFTAIFESSVANSWQGVGLIAINDEFSFGYNGTTFGVWYRYNGEAEVRTITIDTAAGGAETLTLTLNSVEYTISLTSGTAAHNAYEIANWLNNSSNQTVWQADQVDDTVIISALSDGAKSGTYSCSSTGTADCSFEQNQAGVTKTSEHIAQADWTDNKAPWLDPSKGNVYQIHYQYLGFGNVSFFIEDPNNGNFLKVHTIKYANDNTTPSVTSPSFKLGLYAASVGSTTDLVVKSASMAGFTQGRIEKTRNPRAISNTQTLSTTNETNVLTIRNRRTYNSKINQVEIEPLRLTVASESNKNVIFRLRSTTDTGVEQNFTPVGTNLVADVDTTSVGFSGGRLLDVLTVSPTGSDKSDLTTLEIRIPPTVHLVVTAQRTGGASADVTASLTWYEDL